MSQIICNSGPLIALGLLGRLDLLKSLFDAVMVPEAVQKEIERGGIKLAGLEDFLRADWIRVLPLQKPSDALLESLLDVGEAAGSVASSSVMVASVDIKMFAGIIVNGPPGSNYLIQSTPTLPGGWTTLTNIVLPTQPYIYIDYSSPTNGRQFYRAVPQ